MRYLIVSAADESFMPLLRDLVLSLEQWGPLPARSLGILDLGLIAESVAWLAEHGATIVTPGWDLPVSEEVMHTQPYRRAFTARPFLPRYFPGYDVYLWLDADTWVQDRAAIEWYLAAARDGALAAATHSDRCYVHTRKHWQHRLAQLTRYFGEDAASSLLTARYVNSGAFALRADAPHWESWARWFKVAMENTGGAPFCDQSALNFAIWTDKLPVHPLPATANWLCHLAMPMCPASGQFRETFIPHALIGIMHLTAGTKTQRVKVVNGDGWLEAGLTFSRRPAAIRAGCA